MMKRYTLLFLFLLAASQLFSQTYSGPESAEYDYVNRRWLIGNTTSRQILSRDSLGVLSVLVNNTGSGPYGIEIVGDTVYCCSGGSIKGYSLANGLSVFTLSVGGTFLNGLTYDKAGNLITTDFSTKKIFKVNIAAQTFTTIATALPQSPNGIVFDEYNNRCVFVNWGSNAPIRAIDLSTNVVSTLLATSLSNCDGITRDGAGRYYISNWGLQSVVRYDSSFLAPPTTVATSLSNPADIFYNVVDDTLAIPNAGNNTVTFVGFSSTVGINNPDKINQFYFYPNPAEAGSIVQLTFNSEGSNIIQLIDLNGKLINEYHVEHTAFQLNTDGLKPGMYFIRMTNDKQIISRSLFIR